MAIAQERFDKAQISLFFDPAYVDTDAVVGAEGNNLKQVLEAAGHIVTTFSGTSTEAWRASASGANVLVIPALDKPAALTLSAGAIFFLKEFVSSGGTLITTGLITLRQPNTDLLDHLFDTAFNELASGGSNPPSNRTADANGTVFGTGATSLPGNDAVDVLEASSLPSFAVSLYQAASGHSTVAAFQYGKGQVIWLGWDWYSALPEPGTQDGGWNDILLRSISTTDKKPNGVIIKLKGKGDDKVKPDPALKTFSSTGRDDVISGNKGDNKIFAGDGHDVVNGGAGKDKLHGGEDDDILNGGKNKDQLWGDLGGDYFLFDQKPGGRHADKIIDFIDGIDLILLKQGKFAGLTAGNMSATQFAAHIDYAANGWLKYDGKKFAKLDSGLAINEADFLVV